MLSPLGIVIILLVIAAVIWIVTQFVPITDPTIAKALRVILILVCIGLCIAALFWILAAVGLVDYGHPVATPPVRVMVD